MCLNSFCSKLLNWNKIFVTSLVTLQRTITPGNMARPGQRLSHVNRILYVPSVLPHGQRRQHWHWFDFHRAASSDKMSANGKCSVSNFFAPLLSFHQLLYFAMIYWQQATIVRRGGGLELQRGDIAQRYIHIDIFTSMFASFMPSFECFIILGERGKLANTLYKAFLCVLFGIFPSKGILTLH